MAVRAKLFRRAVETTRVQCARRNRRRDRRMKIEFDRSLLGDLEQATSREWLETNGLGGFASSTIIGLNTRRYHGLLVAATKPPVGRLVLLSKLEEVLILDGERFELSANRFPGAIYPQGYSYLKRFCLDPFPVFTYQVAGIPLEKSVFLIQGENTVVVHYRLKAAERLPRVQLQVRPLVAFRDYHSTTNENAALNPDVQVEPGRATLQPYAGLPALHIAHTASHLDTTGYWYRNFIYEVERERGLDFQEDLFSPFALIFELGQNPYAAVIASTEVRDAGRAAEYEAVEVRRRKAVVAASPNEKELAPPLAGLVQQLTLAADQFIVTRGNQKTIIAGYHWFSDWGRDTMVALPGLALVTGRSEIARSILSAFAKYVDRGMLPNRFPNVGEEPEYNTVDATLWFFEAVRKYLDYTGDAEFVGTELYRVLADMVDWHVRGTRYGIHVDADGLLACGEPGVQLTWMDAKVDDWVVTPRYGKPVEIQALWYNALRVMEDLAGKLSERSAVKRYAALAVKARRSFNQKFWNETDNCLYDVVHGEERDASLRPNQIFAVSLPHTMLSRERAKRVVEKVESELLTPYGLRTLAPGDPRYVSHYPGDVRSRDAAYHQGTVWPWLMGPFLTAYLRVNRRSRKAIQTATEWLANFEQHLLEAGLGQVSEIFDGDPPHTPRGCIAQAWSVAELLRAAVEDVSAVSRKTRSPRSAKRKAASGHE